MHWDRRRGRGVTVCMSRLDALRFVVLSLIIIVIHHTIQVRCGRGSWNFNNRRSQLSWMGELASNRLNTLMELRRGTRVAFDREFRCTLAERSSAWSEALSWAGSRCEGWLPMVTSRSLICRAGDRLWRGLPLSGERGGIGGGARSTSRVCGGVEARLVSLIACFSL